MQTLFERVVNNSEDGSGKLSVHMVQALMSEVSTGRLTLDEAATVMQLTIGQKSDYQRVLVAALSASNSGVFYQRVFNYLVLAENRNRVVVGGNLDSYGIESNFWAMVDAEATK